MDYDLIIAFAGLSSAILTCLLWIVFLFYSVHRIENNIISDGKMRPWDWDPIGWRAFAYSWAIVLPIGFFSKTGNRIINAHDVKKHANKKDFTLALLFFIFHEAFLIMIIIGSIFSI